MVSKGLIQQVNVLQYNALNSSLMCYIELHQAIISITLICQSTAPCVED